MEQGPSEIILDASSSPIKGKEHWSWFVVMGDEEGIVSFLKSLASCTLSFSLLVPSSINTKKLTIAREKAREIITPSIFYDDRQLWAFLDKDVSISLFPFCLPWDGMREFEEFLRLATGSSPSLVVLPSRWKRLLPSIKGQTHLRVRVLNEQGGMVPRAYLGYEKSQEQQPVGQKESGNNNTDIKYSNRRQVIKRTALSEKRKQRCH